MSLVEFKDVYKIYKMGEVTINAVEGVSFNIEQGEFCLVVGASVQARQPYLIFSAEWIPVQKAVLLSAAEI